MIAKALFSSRNENWGTPADLFRALDAEFHFTLDAAADHHNHKCAAYFTKEMDALSKSWETEGAVFCNPPYGRDIGRWCKKAYEEALKGQTIVLLVHARTDTQWFHDWVYHKAELRFLRGRLKFTDENGETRSTAPFPSMIAIYRGGDGNG